mgnify:CR=1 FL=1
MGHLLNDRQIIKAIMKKFAAIYQRALERKGGEKALNALLSNTAKSATELAAPEDEHYLDAMSKAIFKAGFVWKIVDYKWAGFEQAFWNFNVTRCAWMSPDDIDQLLSDSRIIKHHKKILAVQSNAAMLLDIQQSHGSFGRFIADWPAADFVGLLNYLHKHGSRLGPRTCQYFLRHVGKQGFIIGTDGAAALIDAGVIDGYPSSNKDMQKVQSAYNEWQQQSGLNLNQLSQVLALSIDVG